MDCSPPGSSVRGIPQDRILEWLSLPSPGDLPHPGIEPTSLAWQADALQLHQQGSFVLNPQSNKTEAARVQPCSHGGPDASLPEAPLQRAWPVHSNALSLFRAMPQRWTRPLTTASGASGGEEPPPFAQVGRELQGTAEGVWGS